MLPILSICIPTYNRPELLVSALDTIVPQVCELGGEVELIVSDNCSTDETREVVERAARLCPVRYHRNDENVGAVRNILGLAGELARGEFCWLLGDDEMLRPGAVRNILRAIKENPDLDYFYVNYSIDAFTRREGRYVTADDFREWTWTGNENLEERRIERWETLLGEDFNCLTPIYCSVFRRSMWLKAVRTLKLSPNYSEDVSHSSVDETFPHSLVFARTMMGKPAWVSGYPWVVMCGKESWAPFIPAVVLLHFPGLFEAYAAHGADPRLVDSQRKRMFGYAGEILPRLFQGEKFPGLESLSFPAYVWKNRRYREMWRAIQAAALNTEFGQIAGAYPSFLPFAVPVKILARLRRGWGSVRTRLGLSSRSTGF